MDKEFRDLWSKKSRFIREKEMLSEQEAYELKGAIYAEFGKVITIAVGYFVLEEGELQLRTKVIANDEEKKVLSEFSEVVNSFDPFVRFCAHNGKEFDFPYLCRRMLINGIHIPEVLNVAGKKPWEIQHIDTLELWKFGDYKHFTSLELLAKVFNLPTSKGDVDGSMVGHVYHVEKDLIRIAKYCREDIILTARLFMKLNLLGELPDTAIIRN